MFRLACAHVGALTRPVVVSWITADGTCASRIGACLQINDEGWVATTSHILEFIGRLNRSKAQYLQGNVSGGEPTNGSANGKGPSGWKDRVEPAAPDSVRDYSAWWGTDGMRLLDARFNEETDAAIGRLDPFSADMMPAWPELQHPSDAEGPGTSLCKLGFPFHRIVPEYDEQSGTFNLPPGSVPLPFFPIEGIYARTLEMAPRSAGGAPPRFIETSSPSLPGHSGGPLFDANGRIWGIQSHTAHYALGLRQVLPIGEGTGESPQQFLNVGRAIHISSILRLLDEFGVAYKAAPAKPGVN